MGHRVGTMACHPSDSGIHIDIERGESTPLLKKHYDYKPTIGKQAWDPKCVILSCFLIVGSFIGLYLLFEQGIVHILLHLCCLLYCFNPLLLEQTLKFNVPFFMVERSVLNFASPTSLLLRSGQAATPMENASGVIILNTRFPQCFTKQMCTEIIKSLISLGVPVQQNFLIGGDGHVYEVLGWDHPSKLEEFIQKRSMITVGFMGSSTFRCPF